MKIISNKFFAKFTKKSKTGISLPELMVAVLIISVGLTAFLASFAGITRSILLSKSKTIASNLAQEKMESLKQQSYYRLLVTISSTNDSNFNPVIEYDTAYYPEENITIADQVFIRRVYISKVRESSGDLEELSWSEADSGLKLVKVYVVWNLMNKWRKFEISNLRENPDRVSLNATVDGEVESGGSDLENASVRIVQNTSYNDTTDAGGDYSFSLEPGTFTVRASKTGYFMHDEEITIESDETQTVDFDLVAMASGSVSGVVWLKDHIVISQVVGSSITVDGFAQEYVELFNPTISQFEVAKDATTPYLDLIYQKQATSKDVILLNYSTLSIPVSGYYLIANTTTVHVAGVQVTADAVYDPAQALDTIKTPQDGGIGIAPAGTSDYIDQVAWQYNGVNVSSIREGTPINQWAGFEENEQYIRKAWQSGTNSSKGRCYDSNNNNLDFFTLKPIIYEPRNSTTIQDILTGTPALGALVFVDDGLSSSAQAYAVGSPPNAEFMVQSVATGTWNVLISSGINFVQISTVAVSASADTSLGLIYFSTTATEGYVSGTVKDTSSTPLADIVVEGVGDSETTNSDGRYCLRLSEGLRDITANPNNQNSDYVSQTVADVAITAGNLVSGIDFQLNSGGSLTGFTSTNGVDPLPDIPVTAKQGSTPVGEAISDVSGIFTIVDLPVGSYTVEPFIESQESCSPETESATVVGGNTVFVTTFTISNAYGTIAGSVTNGGEPIKTGVLIIITTTTVGGTLPPTMDATARAGAAYYCVSSNSSGEYSASLPGGFNYNVYGWYTTFEGETPDFTKQTGSISLSAGGSEIVNLSW
ncbi:MAG: carboxypeptidase regulatory-like domain-containing protein [bacterium]